MRSILLLLALCLMATPISAAFTQNFQDTLGYTTSVGTGFVGWRTNNTGGNSYVNTSNGATWIINSNAEQTTYAAGTVKSANAGGSCWWRTYDSSMVLQDSYQYGSSTCVLPGDRVEMKSVGGTVYWYKNGILKASYAVAANPSYVGFGSQEGGTPRFLGYDDLVYGSTAQHVVYDMPKENVFIIKKDMLNPAASGFAYKDNGTIIYTTYLPTSWSKDDGANESMVLANAWTGTVYATKYTGARWTGDESWDIQTALVNSGAPYGEYEVYIPNRTGVPHSAPIYYTGYGGAVSFDADSYSQQDTATINWDVYTGGYWDSATYSYKVVIYSGNTGEFLQNSTVTLQTGSTTYTWTEDDEEGAYYAVLIATSASGQEFWMNFDYADVSGDVTFTGWVNNESAMPVEGANVSFSQGSTASNSVTIADGNYTATGFLTGANLVINVTATGYSQYYVSMIPMVAKNIPLNITINSTTPTYAGLGIGGIARDGVFDGYNLTKGYGRPIEGVTVMLVNTSNGESYSKTTNMAGWYLCDEGTSCFLTTGRPYDVWGEKLGYGNSPNYTAVA